jgi:hypothetical protein
VARVPDVLCAGGCGKLIYSGKGSLPPGQAMCQPCRRRAGEPKRKPDWVGHCFHCDCEITSRRPRQWCSNRCKCAARKYPPGVFAMAPPKVKPIECNIPWASCLHCHGWFVARAGKRVHGNHCAHKLRYVPKTTTVFYACRAGCGAIGGVVPRQGGWTCQSCMAEAKRRRVKWKNDHGNNHRRRARYYGVEYVPFSHQSIFERDGWQCYICDRTVDPDAPNNHPLQPTIDHVVPMSKGGPHIPSNVRCACRECNTHKGTLPWESEAA